MAGLRQGARRRAAGDERNIALLLQYDGLPFHGWQVQPQSPTVQEVLQGVLGRITGEEIRLKGSGRTDAGVHALGQVANFRTTSRLAVEDFPRAVNSLAPASIAVLRARQVPAAFDSQYNALGKIYRYRLLLRRWRDPLDLGRLWHIPYRLNLHRMRRASRPLVGRHDFSSFRSAGCASRDPVRTLRRLSIRRRRQQVEIELEADGFLRRMVRNIVGTLVDVGRGHRSPEEMPALLAGRDRSLGGRAAPPQGLYLVEVHYRDLDWEKPGRHGLS